MNQEDLFSKLCTYSNLELAFIKARKRKTLRSEVIKFESSLQSNLLQLQLELQLHSYNPEPLKTFIIRDPKTRKISKSCFRDRIVHHALCNIIEPFFENSFIFDSYANRIGKGAFKAIGRYEYFSRKVSNNYVRDVFVLKADIKHYFDNVNHNILISIIQKKISDPKISWLIKKILNNYHIDNLNIGMPLGNLTSQFFANIYLNELDQFVKHKLKAKYYIRYVDDFVILHESYQVLEKYKEEIEKFLKLSLLIQLHPEKSKILPLKRGVDFLGLKVFPYYRLIKHKNLRKFQNKFKEFCHLYDNNLLSYDQIYDFLEGWIAYTKNANTYKLRKRILKDVEKQFRKEISTKEINRFIKNNKTNSLQTLRNLNL